MNSYEEITGKIISTKKTGEIFTSAFRDENTIVFTNGCFDLLHRGHIYYLSKAKDLGTVLVIGLNSDASVSALKGPGRPVNDQQARAEVLGALSVVDYIVIFNQPTPLDLINSIKPHILVKGGDYKEDNIVGGPEVISWGGKVVTVPILEGYSTSSIISRSS